MKVWSHSQWCVQSFDISLTPTGRGHGAIVITVVILSTYDKYQQLWLFKTKFDLVLNIFYVLIWELNLPTYLGILIERCDTIKLVGMTESPVMWLLCGKYYLPIGAIKAFRFSTARLI